MSIFFKDKEIDDYKEPYIIAEIGSNHNGDMDLARKMIISAKTCGANAVKFQSWDMHSLVCEDGYEQNKVYAGSKKKHFGSLSEMVEKYYLRKEQHYELKEYCDSINIDFCSTPFSEAEIDLLIDLDVPFLKIASMDVNNHKLLSYAAKKGKPIVLSTGMATLGEIEMAVKTIKDAGPCELILLHCVSIYPPKLDSINLRTLATLRQAFNVPVGFSDHTLGTTIPLASVALGACIIEKHFTIDKNLEGWDHEISANPTELEIICSESKKINAALGSRVISIKEDQEEKKKQFRRSIVLNKSLKKGYKITTDDISFKRPGTGIPPESELYVVGRILKTDVERDRLLKWEHLL